jgi:FkbM family methyltransferase
MIISYAKSLIYKIIKKFGYNIIKNQISFDNIYKKNFNSNIIIFDVGANTGQSIRRFSSIFPKSIIHSFEPIKVCYEKICLNYPSSNFIKNNFALSDKIQNKKFFFNKFSPSSSFLQLKKKYSKLEKGFKQNNFITKTMTLDAYVNFHKIKKIDILKIDTQGHELMVLKGGKNVLKNFTVNFIEIELIFADLYKNKTPYLYELDFFLNKNNFGFYSIEDFNYDSLNRVRWCNLLYKKN